MNQADLLDEDRRLQAERETLNARLAELEELLARAAEGDQGQAARREQSELRARLEEIERKRAAVLQQILHGGVRFGGE